jgi:hypothetical protein
MTFSDERLRDAKTSEEGCSLSVRVFARGLAMHVVAGVGVAAILSDAAARSADADLLSHETASHKDHGEGKHRDQAHRSMVTGRPAEATQGSRRTPTFGASQAGFPWCGAFRCQRSA